MIEGQIIRVEDLIAACEGLKAKLIRGQQDWCVAREITDGAIERLAMYCVFKAFLKRFELQEGDVDPGTLEVLDRIVAGMGVVTITKDKFEAIRDAGKVRA